MKQIEVNANYFCCSVVWDSAHDETQQKSHFEILNNAQEEFRRKSQTKRIIKALTLLHELHGKFHKAHAYLMNFPSAQVK